jgi:hypothetical protein
VPADDEVQRLRREIVDARAALEALLLSWREQDPTERDPGEVQAALEAIVHQLRGALAGTEEGKDEVRDVMEHIQNEFERGE